VDAEEKQASLLEEHGGEMGLLQEQLKGLRMVAEEAKRLQAMLDESDDAQEVLRVDPSEEPKKLKKKIETLEDEIRTAGKRRTAAPSRP
jgi:hypothetical protein